LTNTATLILFTSRYQAKDLIKAHPELLPLGFTLGVPRWKLSYQTGGNLRQLGPQPDFRYDEDRSSFRAAYRAHLDTLGVAGVGSLIWAALKGSANPQIAGAVLLCFEDLTDPAQWCHRQFFAEWWEEKTGQPVLELA